MEIVRVVYGFADAFPRPPDRPVWSVLADPTCFCPKHVPDPAIDDELGTSVSSHLQWTPALLWSRFLQLCQSKRRCLRNVDVSAEEFLPSLHFSLVSCSLPCSIPTWSFLVPTVNECQVFLLSLMDLMDLVVLYFGFVRFVRCLCWFVCFAGDEFCCVAKLLLQNTSMSETRTLVSHHEDQIPQSTEDPPPHHHTIDESHSTDCAIVNGLFYLSVTDSSRFVEFVCLSHKSSVSVTILAYPCALPTRGPIVSLRMYLRLVRSVLADPTCFCPKHVPDPAIDDELRTSVSSHLEWDPGIVVISVPPVVSVQKKMPSKFGCSCEGVSSFPTFLFGFFLFALLESYMEFLVPTVNECQVFLLSLMDLMDLVVLYFGYVRFVRCLCWLVCFAGDEFCCGAKLLL